MALVKFKKSKYHGIVVELATGTIGLFAVLISGYGLWGNQLIGSDFGVSKLSLAIGAVILLMVALRQQVIELFSETVATGASLLISSLVIILLATSTPLHTALYGLILALLCGMLLAEYASFLDSALILSAVWFVLELKLTPAFSLNITQLIVLLLVQLAAMFVGWQLLKSEEKANRSSRNTILNDKLDEEKNKANILIEAISDCVVVTDTSAVVQIINKAAQETFGWLGDDAISISSELVIPLFDEKGNPIPRESNPINQVMRSGEAIKRDLSVQTKNKRIVTMSASIAPIKTHGNKVNGTIVVMRDVSIEREQEQRRAEFVSTASHEMRTPVAAIEGYLALAMNPKLSNIDEKAKSYIVKARASTKRLGELFQDLLTASKSEDGRLVSHPTVVNTDLFLEKIIEEEKFTAEEKNLDILMTYGGKAKTAVAPVYLIHVDENRMAEVVTNLINNAIKFTEKGGVTVDLSGDEKTVQIVVRDSGLGIPEEDIRHLFEKFYRVDSSATRTIGGTGLGLFISRQIIELYNGRIWVESKPGEGSSFFIRLPRLSTKDADQLKTQQPDDSGL